MDHKIDYDLVAALLQVDRFTLPATSDEPELAQPQEPPLVIDLTDEEWAEIKPALPALPVPKPGVAYEDRKLLDAARWLLAARQKGMGWGRLPEKYGPESSRRHRWARWAMLGYWRQVADAVRHNERLGVALRDALDRLADDADRYRDRVLEGRARLASAL